MNLTNRDIHLLKSLSSYGMLSTGQIGKYFFNSIAKTTVLRRLRILEEPQLIKRVLGLENQQTLWMLTIKGAREVKVTLTKKYWSKNMLEHDFHLNELRLSLESVGVVHSWMPEHEIRSVIFKKHGAKGTSERIVPDGLIGVDVNGSKQSIALELELTLKNQERIQCTMKKYLAKQSIYGVWYVAPTMTILNSVWKHWQLCGGANSKMKFHLSLYSEVLSSPIKAKLNGQRPIRAIGESWSPKMLTPTAQGVSRESSKSVESEAAVSGSNHTPNLEKEPERDRLLHH